MHNKLTNFLSNIELHTDEPLRNNLSFDYEKHGNDLCKFIIGLTKTPFCINIDGKWGSGKTTLLDLVIDKLEHKNDNKLQILKFEPWKYKESDVSVALLQQMIDHIDNNEKKKKILKFAAVVLSDYVLKNSINFSLSQAHKRYVDSIKKIKKLEDNFKRINFTKKLIVFIDDVDRCDPDSIFLIFKSIKLFLSVKNVIFIFATDLSKLEQAWELKYKSKNGMMSGREYFEKFFQLKLSVTYSNKDMYEKYLKSLLPSLNDDEINDILDNVTRNPRSIKRALNILHYILTTKSFDDACDDDHFDSYIKTLLIWITLTLDHHSIAKIIQLSPSYLVYVSILCSNFSHLSKLIIFANSNYAPDPNSYPKHILEILDIIVKEDRSAFRLFKNYAKQNSLIYNSSLFWDIDDPQKLEPYADLDHWTKKYSDQIKQIKSIVDDSGLIGA